MTNTHISFRLVRLITDHNYYRGKALNTLSIDVNCCYWDHNKQEVLMTE